jgi:hypothetical protein
MSVGAADISDYEFTASEAVNTVAAMPARDATGIVQRHDRRQTVRSLVGKAAQAAAIWKMPDRRVVPRVKNAPGVKVIP